MPEAELTEEMIAADMAKADARICIANARCYPFPDRLEDARETCTPKGRCKVGWVVRASGRESWDVSVEVSKGLVQFIPRMWKELELWSASQSDATGETRTRSHPRWPWQ
jgi:hypothetical protein